MLPAMPGKGVACIQTLQRHKVSHTAVGAMNRCGGCGSEACLLHLLGDFLSLRAWVSKGLLGP